jgi:hypothetical protein
MSEIFNTISQNFFSLLAGTNKEHYASLLIIYYRLFQENSRGIDRETVLRSFTDYISQNKNNLQNDDDITGDSENSFSNDSNDEAKYELKDDRSVAGRFLRRLIGCDWLSEETLKDYSRVINMVPYARPFFEALAQVEEGLKTEYESHVVAIYSLLCTDAVQENGHYAVLNAHNTTIALIDSLKILSQSIKLHYERFSGADQNNIADILHLHYDLYADAILDGAYKRLKTSDNLSRYRPRILKQVAALLSDDKWIKESAQKLSRIQATSIADAAEKIKIYLEEIRDTLRAVDPLLEDIDKRNMLYSRASIERVKALLEPDSTISGKIAIVIKAVKEFNLQNNLAHRVFGIRCITPDSLYRRHRTENAQTTHAAIPVSLPEDIERAEAELRKRLQRQLSAAKISQWLDSKGGEHKLLTSTDLTGEDGSFVHFVYSILYADSRSRFDYALEDKQKQIETENYIIPDVTFRRKK